MLSRPSADSPNADPVVEKALDRVCVISRWVGVGYLASAFITLIFIFSDSLLAIWNVLATGGLTYLGVREMMTGLRLKRERTFGPALQLTVNQVMATLFLTALCMAPLWVDVRPVLEQLQSQYRDLFAALENSCQDRGTNVENLVRNILYAGTAISLAAIWPMQGWILYRYGRLVLLLRKNGPSR